MREGWVVERSAISAACGGTSHGQQAYKAIVRRIALMTPANFGANDLLEPFLFLSGCDVLLVAFEVVLGGGVEVEVGSIELELGRLVYIQPSTPLTYWTGERLSFEFKYAPWPSICTVLLVIHPVEDMRGQASMKD